MAVTQRLAPSVSHANGEGPELLATIEAEIVPRLMLAHRTEALVPAACAQQRLPPTHAEVFELARIAACHDLPMALALVETLCREGLTLESVLLDLVAPAARLLGEHWKDDLRTFTEVSAGLGTLQQLVHVLGPSFAPTVPHRGLVLILAAPGEQHTLGVFLAGEFLRKAGWGVQVDPSMGEAEVLSVVGSQHVELLGISVSNSALLKPLARLIGSARKASRNPSMGVMLGGSLELADFAARNDALLCTDPREAVRWLEVHAQPTGCRN
jgi:MerR family transcriptional regulator, light-induced transcriptional regulator